MNEDLEKIERDIQNKKQELAVSKNSELENIFEDTNKQNSNPKPKNNIGGELVEKAFGQAIVKQVRENKELQDEMLNTADTFTRTKMQTIKTDVDTEHKKSIFNNKKDACESYGFNETTTPIWATKAMNVGYSCMLAIWLFIGTFTFMPIIFVMKKINVGLKNTWLAIIFALIIYFIITIGLPLLMPLLI